MKDIKKKSIIAVGLTALSTLALGVGAIVLGTTKENPTGFKGTYDLTSYAATSINQITVGGKEVDITETATFISTDEAYTLCLTVIDMADFGENFTTPLQVGYKIAEGGKYYNGSAAELSGVVYSSLTFANGDSLAASSLTLGDTFEKPYFIVAEVSAGSVKLATPECIVGAESGFEVVDEHMDHVYLVNQSLDTANLVVNSLWSYSVGGEDTTVGKKLTASEYTIGTTDMTTAGEKTVSVTYGGYAAQTIDISVLNTTLEATDGRVSVNVSASHSGVNGALVDGVHTFKSVKDAINFYEALKLDSSVYKIINVGAGTYEDKITTALDNLVLIGEGEDKSVMTYSAVESTIDPVTGTEYGLKCATLHVTGDNFKAYNMTIRNDFDYINQAANYTSPQGVALTIDGDGAVIYNTHLYGNQDTLYLKSGRSYFYQSQIDGNIDFIFGGETGLAYFEECTITAISKTATDKGTTQNGYVTAAKHTTANKPDYGYIFDSCNFTDDGKVADGAMSLGRPWGEAATVAYINCNFSKAYATSAYGSGNKTDRWSEMSGNLPTAADFCEYGSTGEGAISTAVTGGRILTEAEAANYTKANIFAATNGLQSSTKFNWELEYSILRILAGLDSGDLPEETTKTVNFKDETLPNGNCVTAINEKYSDILTWTGYGNFETAKPTNGVKVGLDTVVTFNIVGEVTVKAGYYLSSSDYKITYKNGMATVTIVAISGQYGDFIGSFVIDTSVSPAHTHEYGGEWTVVTTPTESNEGTATRACVDCEDATPATQELTLPVLSEENYIITASSNEGKSTYTYNSETYGEITFEADSLAGLHVHAYGDWVVTATLESAGTATKTCSATEGTCDAKTVTIDLPALTSDQYVITNNTATLEAGGTGTYTYTDATSGEVVTFTAETAALELTLITENYMYTYGGSGDPVSTDVIFFTNCGNSGGWVKYGDSATITLNVSEGATIKFTRSPYDNATTVKVNGVEQTAEKNEEVSYTVSETGYVVISADTTAYLKSISVTYPGEDVITEDTTISFGTEGNYQTYIENGKLVSTCQIGGSNTNNSQVKNGTLTLKVTTGATVVITAYNNASYVGYTVTLNGGTASDTQTGNYTVESVAEDTTIIITPTISNNYLVSIAVTYQTV
ncbi:MAG: pectinesterase family protein [Candidatus Coproplasma sp.]